MLTTHFRAFNPAAHAASEERCVAALAAGLRNLSKDEFRLARHDHRYIRQVAICGNTREFEPFLLMTQEPRRQNWEIADESRFWRMLGVNRQPRPVGRLP